MMTGTLGTSRCKALSLDEKAFRVRLKVREVRLTEEEGMLSRRLLASMDSLSELLILRKPRGTNYELPEEQAKLIKKLWDERRKG